MWSIRPVRVFEDNYVWLISGRGCDDVVVVDPGDGPPVVRALHDLDLQPRLILVTHRHADHVGGVADVLAEWPTATVYAPAEALLPRVDVVVDDGDRVRAGSLDLDLEVIAVPGHTLGHVAYVAHGIVFAGDTLFAGGCGRVFEGTMAQMYASLERLAALPPETEVYCGHEYTVSNLEFAARVEPDNDALAARLRNARTTVAAGDPTVPSTLAAERATNPFLRCREPAVVESAGRRAGRPVGPGSDTFAVVRRWKDGG
jgi:hydroxyacylglutathione hydrolase